MLEQFEKRSGVDVFLLEDLHPGGHVPQAGDNDVNPELVDGQLRHLGVGEAPRDGLEKIFAGLPRQLLHGERNRPAIEDGVATLEVIVQDREDGRRWTKQPDSLVSLGHDGQQQLRAQTVIEVVALFLYR